jgi:uncharacterized protein
MNKKYIRTLEENIKTKLFKNKVICIFGPRRAGKTTLSKKILSGFLPEQSLYLTCEDLSVRAVLVEGNAGILRSFIATARIVVLDEAQTVENIGAILKLFVDTYPDIQLLVTGSSSFELSNRIGEPLVGRTFDFFLAPLSYEELLQDNEYKMFALEKTLLFGSYPQVVTATELDRTIELSQITNSYLYKDIFTFENIKKPKVLEDLLILLAHQIGSEINPVELATILKVSRQTVLRYIELLEKSYVIRRLFLIKRNKRDGVKNDKCKIYFYDLGIRNMIIQDFRPLPERSDIGALFENYFIIERMKYFWNHYLLLPSYYFWRNKNQYEVDLIEERNSQIYAYECKWTDAKVTFTSFLKSYPTSKAVVVHRNNVQDYLL